MNLRNNIHGIYKKLQCLHREKYGSVAAIAAILSAVLLGFAAFAVDIAHIMLVRNELQNAADAAALAGADYFYPKTSSGFSSNAKPDWGSAEAAASSAYPAHSSDGVTLTNYEVQSGYWNLAHSPVGLQAQTITPGVNDVPAVQATVRRTAGSNGGPVRHWFAAMMGTPTSDVTATATAICASPGSVMPGALSPFAIPKWITDQAASYNSASKTVKIGSSYHYPDDIAGQWTSFDVDSNSASYTKDLIQNGNPDPLAIGNNIYIQPGTKAVLYGDMGIYVGKDVVFPVVNAVLSESVKQEVPIVAFIGFHVTAVNQGKKYIEGYFVQDVYVGAGGSVGPNLGTYSPPKLVR